VYYPRGYSSKQWEYYSSDIFDAVELNAPFYRWQKAENWASWRNKAEQASKDRHRPFLYAVKAHQYFSHWRQLTVDDVFIDKFKRFVNDDCRKLGPHFGPLLLQFPARFQCTETNLGRLRRFGELVQSINTESQQDDKVPQLRVALEFRHQSWFNDDTVSNVLNVAKEYDLCICLVHLVNKSPAKWADDMRSGFSPRLEEYPFENGCTWGVYIRFHGTAGQYEGSYSDAFLDKVLERCRSSSSAYIFFNKTDSRHPPSAIGDARHICQVTAH